MSENLIRFEPGALAPPVDAAVYTGPDDVVGDPRLSKSRKREILASWVSDARAVENAPNLRRLESGAVVDVDSILDALRELDRSGATVMRLPVRAKPRNDQDDDPPPTPVRAGLPARPIHIDAYGARRLAGGV